MGSGGEVGFRWEGEEAGNERDVHPMEYLLSDVYDHKRLRQGDVVEGTVVRASPGEIMVDIGFKSEGFISSRELADMSPEEFAQIKEGDGVLVYVVRVEDRKGNLILSLRRAQLERDWRRVEKLYRNEEILEAVVMDCNKGGLIVHINKVRGFVPRSQLVGWGQRGEDKESWESTLAAMLGEELRLKIIELDRSRNRLILSERAALREWRREQKDLLLAELKEGDICTGEVSGLCAFGAFVDLGGADGLVHLSELSWRRVSHPSEILQVGDKVDVYVVDVDREKRRIGLSLKRLTPEPWSEVEERYSSGQLVEGTITKLTNFGAFARLDGDIEGLIHVSELSDRRVAHPKEVVGEGDVMTLRIIHIDRAKHRLALSLKRVKEGMDYVEYEGHKEKEAQQEETEKASENSHA